MSKMIDVVGTITFGNNILNMYGDLENPLFRAIDIAELFGYSEGNTCKLISVCEEKDKLKETMFVGGQRRAVSFITLEGLLDIIFESRKPIAKELRKVLNTELIRYRNSLGMNITEQFNRWNQTLTNM